MFDECFIRNERFAPARFCAPLAGYTHSAFRRLLAELGGCGAVWTEMLATRQIFSDNLSTSTWVRRRPQERKLVYQLMVTVRDPLKAVLSRLGEYGVEAVDLNLACNAGAIRAQYGGSALFKDMKSLRSVVTEARRHWPGLLTAKIRLGSQSPDWQAQLRERIRLLEEAGIDALVLHTRFFEDKFRRRARAELVPWVATLTCLPLIANGDLGGPDQVQAQAQHLQSAAAIMLGRQAIVRPWIFAAWNQARQIDYAEIWRKMYHYICEDFAPLLAIRRIKMFTKYYACNFQFGHQFNVQVANAPTLETVLERAEAFFQTQPTVLAQPNTAGI